MTVNDLVVQDAMKSFRNSIKKVSKSHRLYAVADGMTDKYSITDLSATCCELVPDLLQYFVSKYEDDIGLLGTPGKFHQGVSGIRSLLKMRTESFFTKVIVGMFKLQDISKVIDIEDQHVRLYSRTISLFEKGYREHIKAIECSIEIAKKYNPVDDDIKIWHENMLVRAYASHKAFSPIEFDRYMKTTEDFVGKSFEIFVEGPINLYVKLSDDSLVAILNLLSQNVDLKPFKVTPNERLFSDIVHNVVSNESDGGLIDNILIILKESLALVCTKWEDKERVYRSVIGNTLRDTFLYDYENGVYFDKRRN